MKPSLVFVAFIWSWKSFSYGSQSLSKGYFSSPKMLENRNVFSPRMDYEEWTPLGRGDPLKNDPTYDYVPPVLERVHYWMDPSKRTPDPPLPNSGVLVLGSRTESAFTTRPTTPRYQPFQSKESQADSRIDTSSLLDPFFKLMDVSQFNLNFNTNTNNHYKPAPSRIQRPHYASPQKRPQPPQALQRPPYTMLMPPPPPLPPQQTNFVTSQATTVPSHATTPTETPKNATTINPTVLANTENVFKPVAISMPGHVGGVVNNTHNEIKPTVKYQPRKPVTERTTDGTMILPIITMFDNHKKQPGEEFRLKQHQENLNHIQNPTTAKYKPIKTSQEFQTSLRPTQPPKTYTSPSTLRATIAPPVTTTKVNILTTDPMFKHYKQPVEPIKGPFYLIIQGHSKVKTYGASKNPVNRLLTSNEIKYNEDESKKKNFERKTRRLRYESHKPTENKLEDSENEEVRSFSLNGDENLESLEETFPKSNGGSSKKRYLGSNHRRKRGTRRLLSENEEKSVTDKSDNLDLESLIAISDDYDPEDVANILLKDEGSQGSGFGNFALSIFSRSENDGQEV